MRIEELYAVSGFIFDADGDGQQPPSFGQVLPDEFRHVAESSVAGRAQLADDQRGARRRLFGFIGGIGLVFPFGFFRRVTAERQVCSVGAEGKRIDLIDRALIPGGQVHQSELFVDRLLILLQLVLLRLGYTGAVGSPFGIAGEGRLRTERHDLGSAGGYGGNAKLIIPVGAIDAVGQPLPVGRKSARGSRIRQRFKLAVVLWRNRHLGLGVERRRENEQSDGESHTVLSFVLKCLMVPPALSLSETLSPRGRCKSCRDGGNPIAGVILDSSGNLDGTTVLGGASGGTFSACPADFQTDSRPSRRKKA